MARSMRHIAAVFVVLFAVSATGGEVQRKDRFFKIRYKDGTVERYGVRWVAFVDVNVREEGGPAVLDRFPPKLIDDRRCFWDITSRIERQTRLISKRGEEFVAPTLFKTYVNDFRNQGSSWVVTNFRSENCNDARARRESDEANARTSILGLFNGIVDADIEQLKSEFKADAQVVSVVAE
jgi:hypothetical protein